MWLRGKEAPRVYTHTSVNQGVLLAIKYMIRRVLYLCHTMTDRHTCLLTLAQPLLVCISYLVLQSVKCSHYLYSLLAEKFSMRCFYAGLRYRSR
jgi:hypothetical protein